jgi:phage virion morphogenesis protein
MAGIAMKTTIDDRQVRELMRKLQVRARDLDPALKDIGEYMLIETEARFAGEHDPEGRPWTPLKVRTLYGSSRGKKYTKKGRLTKRFSNYVAKRKILTDSHNLRSRIVYQLGRGSVAIGTNVIYARVHQEGAEFSILKTRARIRIPARPYLGANAQNRREFVAIVKDHLLRGAA